MGDGHSCRKYPCPICNSRGGGSGSGQSGVGQSGVGRGSGVGHSRGRRGGGRGRIGDGRSSQVVIGMRNSEDKDLEGSTVFSGPGPSDIHNPSDISESGDYGNLMEMEEEKYQPAKALVHSPSNIIEPDNDSKHRDNLPQTPFANFLVDSSSKIEALDLMEMGEEKHPKWQLGKSKYTLRLQRAWLVHSTWASLDNVCKILKGVSVNKIQCKHIVDHVKVTVDVLKKFGLDKYFVSKQTLEGSGNVQDNLTFDEMHFNRVAKTFEDHFFSLRKTDFYDHDFEGFFQGAQIQEVSSMFEDYIRELPIVDCSSEESLSKKSKINEDFQEFSLQGMSIEENVKAQSRGQKKHGLDEFLCLLLGVLKQVEDLVLFHCQLERVNNEVVERTGLYGEKFVQIHKLLYKLLHFYACLEHCEGTEFAQDYVFERDSCRAHSLLYYLNWNCIEEYESLNIDGNFLNIERATTISNVLERPNSTLKRLYIESSSRINADYEEIRKCRLLVIAALCKCVSIRSVVVLGSNGEEIHELCKNLLVGMDLENLVISSDEPLADNDAMDLSTMLKEKHNLKSLTLSFKGIKAEGAAYLGAMLAENSSFKRMYLTYRILGKIGSKHLIKPSKANGDQELRLYISFSVDGSVFIIMELPMRATKIIAPLLSTNQSLTHFAMDSIDSNPDVACEILDSLKKNKTLQVLDLERWAGLDDARVRQAFMDQLINYNFSLSTIKMRGRDWDIETFMKCILSELKQDGFGDFWNNVGGTSEFPIIRSALDLKQVIGKPKQEIGEGSSNEVYESSLRAFDIHNPEVEAIDERPRLLLNYSNEMKDFAMHLCLELKSSNYNVVDQDSINFAKVVDQCQVAIVVLSNMYMKSQPSMSKLGTIVKSKRTNNPNLKVYPLFFNLTLQDIQNGYVFANTFGGEGIYLDNALEREALNFLLERKNEVLKKANHLLLELSQGRIDVGKFCEHFFELQRSSWPSNGLEFEKNAISTEGYLHAILEEIFYYVPSMKECNSNQIPRHQGKVEIESKLSLRQMKPLLKSLLMTDFYLWRKLNMAQYLQEKYIQYSSFEEMCPLDLNHYQKQEYSKGRITATLFPSTFLYYFKAQMLRDIHNKNFLLMLKAISYLVAHLMQQECNKNGVQTSMFIDFVDFGAPLDPKRTIAMCQNFPTKTSNGSKKLVIVQDDLTGAYYYQCVEALDIGKSPIDETIGIIGVQVASTEIHVDNIHEDGSLYSGVLGDFSYKFDFDESKQCAKKAFGDLEGARFLSKNSGIKCSPLLIIALASAIQKKGLALTWSNGKGHMEFCAKLAHKVKVEVSACQIQYTSNINQLGLEIEWGTGTKSCVPHSQTFQKKTNEIVNQQVIGSNVDQNVGTSSSRNDCTTNVDYTTNMQNDIALFNAATQNKSKYSGALKVAGTGIDFGYETHDSETKQLIGDVFQDILKQRYASKGGFHRISNLDVEYPDLENQLLRCQLHAVSDHNYLVVYNVSKARHISIYDAIEQNEDVPKFKLTWISDIPIDDGEVQIKHIFETGLKGRELIVRRDGSNFMQLGDPSKSFKKIVSGYQESLLQFKSRFPSNAIITSMIPISVPNLIGMLRSKNEWVHILGPQEKYESSYKYWWNATSMEAIVYSRTMYTSGTLLKTHTELPFNGIGRIGYCSVEEGPKELRHLCGSMVSRGKFSRPPGSLLSQKVLWGGLDIELENLSL